MGMTENEKTTHDHPADEGMDADPSAELIRQVSIKPPTKNIANVKAASDIHDANALKRRRRNDDRTPSNRSVKGRSRP